MQPPKKYSVVMVGQDGAHTLYPMKEWCRQNPDEAPPIDPNTNSQQLRRAFIRMGWVTEETETQVLVLHPGTPKTAVQAIENDELDPDEQDTGDSTRTWTPVPRTLEQCFHADLDTHSTATWTLIPRALGQ